MYFTLQAEPFFHQLDFGILTIKTLHELSKNFVELVLLVVAYREGAGFFRAKGEIERTRKGRKGKEAPAAETLAFHLHPQNNMTALHASTDKKLIVSRLSNDMELTSDPKGKITL